MKNDETSLTIQDEGSVRNSRLVGSAFVFAACYILLCLVAFS